jgi:hypothetical protein
MANLTASIFETLDGNVSPRTLSGLILGFARMVELIDVANVVRDINEERSVSGFPEIRGGGTVEAVLRERGGANI